MSFQALSAVDKKSNHGLAQLASAAAPGTIDSLDMASEEGVTAGVEEVSLNSDLGRVEAADEAET